MKIKNQGQGHLLFDWKLVCEVPLSTRMGVTKMAVLDRSSRLDEHVADKDFVPKESCKRYFKLTSKFTYDAIKYLKQSTGIENVETTSVISFANVILYIFYKKALSIIIVFENRSIVNDCNQSELLDINIRKYTEDFYRIFFRLLIAKMTLTKIWTWN